MIAQLTTKMYSRPLSQNSPLYVDCAVGNLGLLKHAILDVRLLRRQLVIQFKAEYLVSENLVSEIDINNEHLVQHVVKSSSAPEAAVVRARTVVFNDSVFEPKRISDPGPRRSNFHRARRSPCK